MKDTQFERNGECQYANYFIQKLQQNSNSRHQNSQREEFRPSLISLDPTDLSRPLFCYTLQLGVTMLGSGKNCPKPPDIVLHGSSVAPQHAFVERLANESVLHPISSQTSLNGRPVQGPTPLQSGALISIGDSFYFRYNSGPSKSPAMQQNQFSPQQATTANPCFYDDESPYAVVNNRGKGSCSVDSAGDVNKNGMSGDALSTCEGSPSKTHRDSLESSNFSNKLARFECLSYKKPPFPTANEQNLYFKPATMPRPSVSFNRSDQGYSSHLFYSNTTPTPESSSSSSSDRFKKPLSGKVTFFDEDEEDASSLANQCSSSIPSPDSLSSISNHRLYFSGGMTVKAHSSSPTDSHLSALTEMEEVDGGDEGGLTCEGLLELRRQRCSPQKTETCLGLDEILAMCAEYEEQIAKEIQEKKSTEGPSSSVCPPVPEERQLTGQNGSLRSPSNESTPTSPHFYSNGRIKHSKE